MVPLIFFEHIGAFFFPIARVFYPSTVPDPKTFPRPIDLGRVQSLLFLQMAHHVISRMDPEHAEPIGFLEGKRKPFPPFPLHVFVLHPQRIDEFQGGGGRGLKIEGLEPPIAFDHFQSPMKDRIPLSLGDDADLGYGLPLFMISADPFVIVISGACSSQGGDKAPFTYTWKIDAMHIGIFEEVLGPIATETSRVPCYS